MNIAPRPLLVIPGTGSCAVACVRQPGGTTCIARSRGRYLARWGFTPQKPARRAYQQDAAAVERWLKEEYPAIQEQARKEGAQIQWGDESGMRSDHTAGRSYSPRGKTPVVRVTGKRFSCNMISSVSNLGKLSFMIYRERFTSQIFIKFLRRLLKQSKGKVFLIVDNHPVHRSKVVKQWVEERADRLRLFYLPGYSPELNPDELVNQDVKSNAVGRKRARDVKELMENIRSFLRRKQRRPDLVRRYFQAPHVAYAAQTI